MPDPAAKPGLTLAIEISNPSSGPRGRQPDGNLAGPGVAIGRLGDEGDLELIDAELLREGTRHDDDLMPAIDRVFARHGLRPSDLARIAVSIGPGGYTSLRIAVATAKMLAEATGAKTVAVPSARVAAWRIPIRHAPAIVCLASKNQAAYGVLLPAAINDNDWWRLHGRPGVERLLGPPAAAETDAELRAGLGWLAAALPLGMITAEQVERLRPAALIADEFLPAPMRDAAARIGATVVEPVFAPAWLLRLSAGRAPIDPVALAPLYGREAEAVTQWRLRKG